jgi:hypothetical protein
MNMISYKSYAYDIAVENADGVTIYYNYINEGRELEVTHPEYDNYSGTITIPEEVTFMNRTRKVTRIGTYTFYGDDDLISVNLPSSVTSIGERAFYRCKKLTSIVIPNDVITIPNEVFYECYNLTFIKIGISVTSIGENAFYGCRRLSSITIPNLVITIGKNAFYGCQNLTTIDMGCNIKHIGEDAFSSCKIDTVIIRDIASWCKIKFDIIIKHKTSGPLKYYISSSRANPLSYNPHIYSSEGVEITELNVPEEVDSISEGAFMYCKNIIGVSFPQNLKFIGRFAFIENGFKTLSLPSNLSTIETNAFEYCNSLEEITIPNSVNNIGYEAFSSSPISVIYSHIKEPFNIYSATFSQNTLYNATLYVPKGTIEKYKATEGWKYFVFIEEESGGDDTPTTQKCEKPTISYQNGKLIFNSETEGVSFLSTITDTDINSYNSSEVQLGLTYIINVYATKNGYDNSDIATATLCWIDAEPTTEGISNNVAQVRAKAVMIQNNGNVVSVSGADRGTEISIYDIAGKKVGSSIATSDITKIATSLDSGSIAIIRIGEKAVKILIK